MSNKYTTIAMKKAALKLCTDVIDNDEIEYWDNQAEKPAILLIHGFGATSKYQWYKQVDLLKDDYRIVAPNLFHFGNSHPGTDKFELSDQVEMVHSLLSKLGIEKYTICGVSYGGLIGMELANKYKSEVEKLVVFDTPVKYVSRKDLDVVCKKFDVDSIETLFVPKNAQGLKKLIFLALGKKSIIPAKWFTKFYNEVYRKNIEDKRRLINTLIDGMEEYSTHNYDISVPTLILWGTNDDVIPASRGLMLKNHIGDNAEYHVLENGSHMPNLTKTKEFNAILSKFLKR